MQTCNIAILGAGHIAEKMARTLQQMPQVRMYAVASRSIDKARAFAAQWGFAKAYGSYAEMLADADVHLVYVATPHAMHHGHMRQCVMAGKAVLCEKSFTCNAAEAADVLRLAEQRKVLVAEAIWTRYMPLMHTLAGLVRSGAIGRPCTLSANLCYPVSHKQRIQSPGLGGGALLDLGVYTLNFAAMLFGTQIERVDTSCQLTPTGMDAQHSITLWYGDGRMAQLFSSIYARSDRQGIVSGTDGHIIVENINNPSSLRVVDNQYQVVRTIDAPRQVTGFEYEVQACIDALQAHRTEVPQMPHAETLRIMQLMDGLRRQWGVRFPNDEKMEV